jgi:hypothetical protein
MSEYIPGQWMYGDDDYADHHVIEYFALKYSTERELETVGHLIRAHFRTEKRPQKLTRPGDMIDLSDYFAWKGEKTFDGHFEDEFLEQRYREHGF